MCPLHSWLGSQGDYMLLSSSLMPAASSPGFLAVQFSKLVLLCEAVHQDQKSVERQMEYMSLHFKVRVLPFTSAYSV